MAWITEGKEKAYQALISDVKTFYEAQGKQHDNEPVYLTWCDACKEINLWTYWQGRGNLDAEIMVVGQDWGTPDKGSPILNNICEINRKLRTDYHFDEHNPTDRNLAKLFCSIGIPIPSGTRDPRLFFTNFVLGYRNHGLTGGFKSRWIRENEGFFLRLAEIVEPKIIICLGRNVFTGVTRSLGKPVRIRNYNAFVTGSQNPVSVTLPGGKASHIFAMAHCGAMGTLNRNRLHDTEGLTGIELQKKDWRRIKDYLNASP